MKCQSLLTGKNNKIINLSSAEFAQRLVKIKPIKARETSNEYIQKLCIYCLIADEI